MIMKKIAVPTDFSECSLQALRTAASIARQLPAEIHLVHVYERPIYGFVDLTVDNDELRLLRKEIEQEFQRLSNADFLKGLPLRKWMLADMKLPEILEHDVLKEVDLVVMGSHGARKNGWLVGSNAEKMVRSSKAPVLVIKGDDGGEFYPRDLVFASNFYGESEDNFEKVKFFSDWFEVRVHLLKVITPGDFENSTYSLRQMESFAKRKDLNDYTINTFNHRYIESGVLEFSHKIKADLIAMETHGRTGLSHLVNGSLTEELVKESDIPVLSVRMKEKPRNEKIAWV